MEAWLMLKTSLAPWPSRENCGPDGAARLKVSFPELPSAFTASVLAKLATLEAAPIVTEIDVEVMAKTSELPKVASAFSDNASLPGPPSAETRDPDPDRLN